MPVGCSLQKLKEIDIIFVHIFHDNYFLEQMVVEVC